MSTKKAVVITAYRDSGRETWVGVACLIPSFAGQVFAPAKPALPPSVVVGCESGAYMEVFTACLRQVIPVHAG